MGLYRRVRSFPHDGAVDCFRAKGVGLHWWVTLQYRLAQLPRAGGIPCDSKSGILGHLVRSFVCLHRFALIRMIIAST